jgi:Ca2+-binding EF-hand superfamily protein
MLINLIKFKNLKLKQNIIDIILIIYSNSKIDNNTLSKILGELINIWFDNDNNIRNRIKPMIQKIYKSLGKYEFISLTKFFTNEQKDEVFLKILEEDEDYFQENQILETEKKGAINKINVKHLQNYKNSCNFKKFVLTYMATRLKEKDIYELNKIFLELDSNKDGTLSVDEIKRCFIKLNKKNNLNISTKEIEDIFKSIDVNNSKRIEYTEFISSMLEESSYCREERLIEIFRMLDKDNSGKISKDEIKKALNDEKVREEDLKNFIKKFDLNGDGEIDYYEFVTCMSDTKEK